MDTKIAKFQQEVLDEMFKMVGFDGFDRKFTKKENWFQLRTWDEEDAEVFRNYFIEKSRRDLKWSKRTANKEYAYFNLMYCWKIKNENI